MIEGLLAWLGTMFSKIFSEVIKDVLKTPAKEVEVTEIRGDVDLPLDANSTISDYGL